jgi:hypothetical protein
MAPDGAEPHTTYYQVIVGAETIFASDQKIAVDDIPDGTSCTILIAEAATAVHWTQPCDLHYAPDQPLPAFGGVSARGFSVAFADGSPRFLSGLVDHNVIRTIVTRNGREPIDQAELDR